ncbi:MAG: TIM barrel protein [Spirochaetota bacterium]
MAKIGVCIEPCFGNMDYRLRLEIIAQLGFRYYDLWFHNKGFNGKNLTDEKKDFDMMAEMNEKYKLVTTAFVHCHPDGGIEAALLDKKQRNRILDSFAEVIPLAKKIKCKALISGSGNVDSSISDGEAFDSIVETLSQAARIIEKEDITIFLEPWNNKVDHPKNWLNSPNEAVAIIKAVNHKNIKLLYDIYHMQIMSGNLMDFIKKNIRFIGHFHMAGVPGRHEPIDNEVNYPFIIQETQQLGYDGVFSLEYWPTFEPAESLKKCLAHLNV